MKSIMRITLVLSLALSTVTALSGPVTVTNVTAFQRLADPIVDIFYDLLNPSGGMHTTAIDVSTDSGATYLSNCTNFSGAVGARVTTGTHLQVEWFAAGDLPDALTTKARVRVAAMEATNNYHSSDVSGGRNALRYPVRHQATAALLDAAHKTTNLALRTIPAGRFVMSVPAGAPRRAPGDVADFVITLAAGDHRTITLTWRSGAATILACTNQYYTAESAQWFELARNVNSPWVHWDSRSYPAVFYRIVSGTHTSQYDVGKYTLTLAPGAGGSPAYNWISTPLELFSNTVDYVLGQQLNYDERNYDILKAQSFIGSDTQIDTYYHAGAWTDFDRNLTQFELGRGYILVVDATHTATKTLAFVGKVPDMVVTNVLRASNGTDAVYNWIGAPSPALRAFFVNGLTNPVVTMEAQRNFDLYQSQMTIDARQLQSWAFVNKVRADFKNGAALQTPGTGGILILSADHAGTDILWAAPKTR